MWNFQIKDRQGVSVCHSELLITLIYRLLVYCSTTSKVHNAVVIPIV